MANDKELVGCRVAGANGGLEDILSVLDQVRSHVEIVYSKLVFCNNHKGMGGDTPVVSKSK